jgi:hypothetical protein
VDGSIHWLSIMTRSAWSDNGITTGPGQPPPGRNLIRSSYNESISCCW